MITFNNIYNSFTNTINKGRQRDEIYKQTGQRVYISDNGHEYISKNGQSYNEDYYDKLLKQHDYDALIRYCKNFRFTDAAHDAEYKANIAGLEQESSRYKALSNQFSADQMQIYDFMDNLYKDNGFENMEDNPYVKKFNTFKRQLGSRVEGGDGDWGTDRYAERLRFYFPEESDNNINAFLSKAGYNAEELTANGVIIEDKSWKNLSGRHGHNKQIAIEFDKSNPLANKLIVEYMKMQRENSGLFNVFSQGGLIQGLSSNKIGGYDVVDEISWDYNSYSPSQAYLNYLNDENPVYKQVDGNKYVNEATAQKANIEILKEHADELNFDKNRLGMTNMPGIGDIRKYYERTGDTSALLQAGNVDEILEKYKGYKRAFESPANSEYLRGLGDRLANESSGDRVGKLYGKIASNIPGLLAQDRLPIEEGFNIALGLFNKDMNKVNQNEKLNYYNTLLHQTIDEGESLYNEIKNKKEDEDFDKIYTSVLGGRLSDETEELRLMYEAGQLTYEQYSKQMKLVPGSLVAELKSTPLQAIQGVTIYSNYENDSGNRDLVEMDEAQLNDLNNLISVADDSDIILEAMINNGEIGTLITLPSKYTDKEKTQVEDPIQVFVPGLFLDKAQQQLNRDTASRSSVEVNNVIANNGEYVLENGQVIRGSSNGKLYLDEYNGLGKRANSIEISKEEAMLNINKSLIKEQLTDALVEKYTNMNNEIIDSNAYEKEARLRVKQAADECHPNIPLVKPDGTPYTDEELFTHQISKRDVSAYTWQKIKYIYDLYDSLMHNAAYYVRRK